MASFASMLPKYTEWLKRAQVRPHLQGAVDRAARALLPNKARYQAVERQTGVPWAWIAAAHYRECNGNMRGCLHNGELIIGTGRKTTLVPPGQGPFATFEESGVHAIKMMGWDKLDWILERMCFLWEGFNGYGYANMGRPSPYVWAGTNIYVQGKYISDGHYDPSHVDTQLGCLPVYLRLVDLAGERSFRDGSRKLDLIGKLRGWIKAAMAAAGGIFTLENLGYLREWFGTAQGMLTTGSLVVLIVGGVGVWWVLNTLDRMSMEDHASGRATSSGEDNGAPPAPQNEAAWPTEVSKDDNPVV